MDVTTSKKNDRLVLKQPDKIVDKNSSDTKEQHQDFS
jgi:hypothetical protein